MALLIRQVPAGRSIAARKRPGNPMGVAGVQMRQGGSCTGQRFKRPSAGAVGTGDRRDCRIAERKGDGAMDKPQHQIERDQHCILGAWRVC